MKIAVLVLCCLVGMVVSENCTVPADCTQTSCLSGFDKHCVDSFCICQSPTTGVACQDDGDCEQSGGSEHCYNDREWDWECVHHECYCRH
ncbi:hypothetical protein ACF0H5_013342 [Mactra antiquata]